MIIASPLEVLTYFHFAKPTRAMLIREYTTTPFIVDELLNRLRNAELIDLNITTERWSLTAKGEDKLFGWRIPVNTI